MMPVADTVDRFLATRAPGDGNDNPLVATVRIGSQVFEYRPSRSHCVSLPASQFVVDSGIQAAMQCEYGGRSWRCVYRPGHAVVAFLRLKQIGSWVARQKLSSWTRYVRIRIWVGDMEVLSELATDIAADIRSDPGGCYHVMDFHEDGKTMTALQRRDVCE